MEQMGLLHLYYGDGKGKTTAAMGLALRALGSGKKVVIVQFLKGGKSGEIPLLEQLGATVYRGKAGQKFVFQMNEAEKAGRVINVTDDLPKTFVITTPPGKKTGEDMVYLCQLSTGTLKKRSGR